MVLTYPQRDKITDLLIEPWLESLYVSARSENTYRSAVNAFAQAVYDWSRDYNLLNTLVTLSLEEFSLVVDLWQAKKFAERQAKVWDAVIEEWTFEGESRRDIARIIRWKEKWLLVKAELSRPLFREKVLESILNEEDGVGVEKHLSQWLEWLELPSTYYHYPLRWESFRRWIHDELPTRAGTLPRKVQKVIDASRISKFQKRTAAQVLSPTDGRDLTFWDLFCGVGGLTYGASLAGMRPSLALEWDEAAAETYWENWKNTGVQVVNEAIEDWIKDLRAGRVDTKRPDCIYAGPPCQGMSTMGKMEGSLFEGHRVPETIEAIHLARPQTWVIENVPSMLENFPHEVQRVTLSLERAGYKVNHAIINPVGLGLPQSRPRLFIVGSLKKKFIFPKLKQYGDRLRPEMPFAPAANIRELFKDERFGHTNTFVPSYRYNWDKENLPTVRSSLYISNICSNKYLRALNWDGIVTQAINRGAAQDWFDTEEWGEEYWIDLRIVQAALTLALYVQVRAKGWQVRYGVEGKKDLAETILDLFENVNPNFLEANGIYIQKKQGHIPGASCLSWEECAALQGFPRDYNWRPEAYPRQPQKTTIFNQIGNAVTSVHGLYIARALIDQGHYE